MFILRLGDNLSAKTAIGNKAKLLDFARHSGLPVPKGVIITDEFYQAALRKRVLRLEHGRVVAPNPDWLMAMLTDVPPFRTALAVRSAFSAEDRQEQSLAGFFTSKLFVRARPYHELVQALCDVWSSALKHDGNFRRDVLLMEMVDALSSGVAFTETEYEDDLVNFTSGTADKLVSGQVEGETLLLPQLRRFETALAAEALPDWACRLQRLLKAIRKVFGARNWDIEWADDGKVCWLVQIRPITRMTRRNEQFTIANHKEIFPELPSPFMTSVVASCAEGLFSYYRKFDATLPAHRPFLEVFIGRPFINLSLMTDMMRHWGLPTRLVTDNIGGESGRVFGLNFARLLTKLPVLLRQGVAQLLSPRSAKKVMSQILSRTAHSFQTFGDAIDELRWLYTALVTEMFSLTAAMSLPLVVLRQLGTLEEHNARQQTISSQIFSDLEPLRQLALKNQAIADALRKNELPDDPAFQAAWHAYLSKHGHRGIYESDIARPRFREQPETLFAAILQPHSKRTPPPRTLTGFLTLPIWLQASRAMHARESLRYTAMIGFERLRLALLELATQATQRRQLPDATALWLMTISEVRALDDEKIFDETFFAQRHAEIERLRAYTVPDLFHRFDDLEAFHPSLDTEPALRLSGVSLTLGTVQGKAWVLREPQTHLPLGFEKNTTILVARSVDAGWIPTFALVAGVVVETGGDLSHGSIILREIGLPAVTNVRCATAVFRTGDLLRLNAAQGLVERLQPASALERIALP